MDHTDGIRVELIFKNATNMFERKGPDIIDISSQPRLCQEVAGRSLGDTTLKPGFSLDLTMNDPATGEPWDLSRQTVQSRVLKLIRDVKPLCFIGSPLCTAFSPLQEISRAKRDPKVMEAELRNGKNHVLFASRYIDYNSRDDGTLCMSIKKSRRLGTCRKSLKAWPMLKSDQSCSTCALSG